MTGVIPRFGNQGGVPYAVPLWDPYPGYSSNRPMFGPNHLPTASQRSSYYSPLREKIYRLKTDVTWQQTKKQKNRRLVAARPATKKQVNLNGWTQSEGQLSLAEIRKRRTKQAEKKIDVIIRLAKSAEKDRRYKTAARRYRQAAERTSSNSRRYRLLQKAKVADQKAVRRKNKN